MGYLKGRSAGLIHERPANLKYNCGDRTFWAKRYVDLNQKTIEKYIPEQDSITKIEYKDPFKK